MILVVSFQLFPLSILWYKKACEETHFQFLADEDKVRNVFKKVPTMIDP